MICVWFQMKDDLINQSEKTWKQGMAFQLAKNRHPNAVILVSPDGTFFTESLPISNDDRAERGKVILDEKNPRKPRNFMVRQIINLNAHTERYLNVDD